MNQTYHDKDCRKLTKPSENSSENRDMMAGHSHAKIK